MSYFNVRVYGLLINDKNELLLSDEFEFGVQFTKFPGGGLEYGEGLKDALKREFVEECQVEIEVLEHIYTTDFFEKSSFNESQIISVYYLVKLVSSLNLKTRTRQFDFQDEENQCFRWVSISKLDLKDLTFKTDQKVLSIIKERNP